MAKHHMLLFLLLCLPSYFLHAQQTMKPKVLIITTGGTIASQTNAPLREGAELIQAVPQLTAYAAVEVEEFVRIGSSKMTPAFWLALVKRIRAVLNEKPGITCVIITHGTDTMEETAFFLNLTHRSKVPIVLVGSMRSSNEVSADGPANLLSAVRVGISPEAIGKGVMVVLNDNISAARDLLKMNNNRVDAFPATEFGFLGSIDVGKVKFYRSPSQKHTVDSEFDVYERDHLPAVDIVQDFAGFDPEILAYFTGRPNEGVVISSFAGGRMSEGMSSVYKLPAAHKPLVIASSIKAGRIMGSNAPDSPIVIANDLPANKARILLMLALTQTKDVGKIQHYFNTY
ncbi:MAG: asparaginase [Saprospiraceae bacterium]